MWPTENTESRDLGRQHTHPLSSKTKNWSYTQCWGNHGTLNMEGPSSSHSLAHLICWFLTYSGLQSPLGICACMHAKLLQSCPLPLASPGNLWEAVISPKQAKFNIYKLLWSLEVMDLWFGLESFILRYSNPESEEVVPHPGRGKPYLPSCCSLWAEPAPSPTSKQSQ